MKKFLLTTALAAIFVPVFADAYSDALTVSLDGKAIQNGETINIAEYYDEIYMQYPEAGPQGEFDAVAHPKISNVSSSIQTVSLSLTRSNPEISEAFPSMGSEYGFFQLCYAVNDDIGNCLPIANDKCQVSNVDIPVGAFLNLDVDQKSFTSLTPVTLRLDINLLGEDKPFTVYFNFTHTSDITLGVENVAAETAKAEYFTLLGVKTANPQKGQIYLVRQGNKTVKKVF